ncbi:MAG: plasmid pRiA4b ORF-3 family protein, partial [Desulfobacterales bacterium]|nr:plasmid pRiA4b ORF-3 family protein [Desulfobacterales bacterium]
MPKITNKKTSKIWTLRVKLPQTISQCIRVIEIESSASFLQMHEAIQDAVDFDNDHLFEFFIGRHPGHRAYSIGSEPNWDTFNPIKTYSNVRLSSVWPLPSGMKLFYLFDFGDNWLFQINKTKHKD